MYRQSEKNLLSSNTSSACPDNMVNFGPLTAEIGSLVWGTPANLNWFRVSAALLHGTLVVGVSQIAAVNRGRHLCSAGRPSRWALAHILVTTIPPVLIVNYCSSLISCRPLYLAIVGLQPSVLLTATGSGTKCFVC